MYRSRSESVSRLMAAAGLAFMVCSFGACATSPSSASPARPTTQTIGGSDVGGSVRISPGSGPDLTTLPFPVAQVWAALPVALDSMSIPVARLDPAQHVIGNDGFKIRQRLGKTSLSRFIDCGQAQIGPSADSYDVMLTVLMQLQSAGEASTKVSTTVQAMAKPVTFNQGYSQCSTKGELETRLLNHVKAQLQR